MTGFLLLCHPFYNCNVKFEFICAYFYDRNANIVLVLLLYIDINLCMMMVTVLDTYGDGFFRCSYANYADQITWCFNASNFPVLGML